MFRNDNNKVDCKCPRRKAFGDLSDRELKNLYWKRKAKMQPKALKENLIKVVTLVHRVGALNMCKTQKLEMMKVEPMRVEFRDKARADKKPIKNSRIIPVALPLKQKTIENLDYNVKIGILERMTGTDSHDLWLSPMIVVSQKGRIAKKSGGL